MIPLLCLFAFLLGITTDWVWTRWMQNITAKNPIYAANWSTAVYTVSLLYTMLIIDKQYIPIIFYLIGGWFGAYWAVKHHE
jgi:hypothetical protein